MIRPSSRLAAAFAALAIAVPVCATAPADAASPGRAAPAVAVTGTNSPFSPNADGSKDRGAVTYRLAKRAYVTVKITGGTSTVLTTKPVRVAKGNHTYVWDGKRAGDVVNDGTYTITVLSRATKHGRARTASSRLVVDARVAPDTGSVRLSSSAVYPRTTVINDVVVGNFLPGSHFFSPGHSCCHPDDYRAARRQVLDAKGNLIDSAPFDSQESGTTYTGWFTWDGRNSRGEVAPAGTYRIRVVRGSDRAGNPLVMAPPVAVRVSTLRLAKVTRTRTVTAATPTRSEIDPSCNGCYEYFHGSAPSTRFEGGRSYDSAGSVCVGQPHCDVSDSFTFPVTGRRTPSDRFDIRAYGGPTTPGGTGSGVLYAGNRSATMSGDTNGFIPSVRFVANTEVPLPGQSSGLQFGFEVTNGESYDLAAFDIVWTMYEPVS